MSINAELLALETDDGLILPEDVVSWARSNPGSELHSNLEWRDDVAGHQYRLWQVRRLIAIHVITPDGNRQRISLMRDRISGGGYRDVEAIMSSGEMRAEAVAEALAEVERWQARYQHLRELAEIFAAVKTVRARRPRRSVEQRPAAPAA